MTNSPGVIAGGNLICTQWVTPKSEGKAGRFDSLRSSRPVTYIVLTYLGIVAVLVKVNSMFVRPNTRAKAVPRNVPPLISCVDPKVHV